MTTPATNNFSRQPKGFSFRGPVIRLHEDPTRNRRIREKAMELSQRGFGGLRQAQLRSLLHSLQQDQRQAEEPTVITAIAGDFLCTSEQQFEQMGLIRRCDAITSDFPHRTDRRPPSLQGSSLPRNYHEEMEITQRLQALRRRNFFLWQNIPCRRGCVHEYLSIAKLGNYIPTLERGLVGPFARSHLSSFETFRERHDQLLKNTAPTSAVSQNRNRQNDLLFALSYRQQPHEKRKFNKDRMSISDSKKLHELLSFLWKNTPRADEDVAIFFWQDQMAKGSSSDNDLDWVNTGIIPYMVLPVVKIVSDLGSDSDEGRLWLSCERMLAELGPGLLTKTQVAVPHENQVNSIPSTLPMAMRCFARYVVAGYLEGKEVTWPEDFLRLNHWAVDVVLCESWGDCVNLVNRESVKTDIKSNRRLLPREMLMLMYNMDTFDTRRRQFGQEAMRLRIVERSGLCHTNWSDKLVIIETDGGETPGGISGPSLVGGAQVQWGGSYELFSDSKYRYFVRLPRSSLASEEVTTGKVTKKDEACDGHVLEVMKIHVDGLYGAVKEMALDMALLMIKGNLGKVAETYVDGSKRFFESTCSNVVCQVWQTNPTYEGSIPPNDISWA